MSELSRRLFLKLAGAAGIAAAVPAVVQEAVAEPFKSTAERIPVFEYFERGKWVEIGDVIDVNFKVDIEMIHNPGETPRRVHTTSTIDIEYYSKVDDPLSDMNRDRFDVRIHLPEWGDRFTFERVRQVEYLFSSNGKSAVTLIGASPAYEKGIA